MSTELEKNAVEIESNTQVVEAVDSTVCPTVVDGDISVEAIKKEYSIVGDAFYASINTDEAPQWLSSILDNLIDSTLNQSLGDLSQANQNIIQALSEIDLAKDNYEEAIYQLIDVDSKIVAKVEQAKVELNGNIASNTNLIATKVTETEAASIAAQQLSASLGSTEAGTIGSEINNLQTAIATETATRAEDVTFLDSQLELLDEGLTGNASAVQSLSTYVGIVEGTPDGTGLLADVAILQKQNDGVIETTTGTYDVMLGVEDPNNNTDNDELVQTAEPYVSWKATDDASGTEEERARHVGDVYIQYTSGDTGYKTYNRAYKFIKTVVDNTSPFATDSEGYTWALITDTDAQNAYVAALNALDLADEKRRVFVVQPTAPYDVGDLWVRNVGGSEQIWRASTSSVSTFSLSHWLVASTDDSAVAILETGLINGTVAVDLSSATIDGTTPLGTFVAEQIDDQVVVFSGTNVNSQTGMKADDIYIEKTTETSSSGVVVDVLNTYKYTGSSWTKIGNNSNLTGLADLADGKRTVFAGTSIPSGAEERDLWIPEKGVVLPYIEGKVYIYDGTSWNTATREYAPLFTELFSDVSKWTATANDTVVISSVTTPSNNSAGLFSSTDTDPQSSGSTTGVYSKAHSNGLLTAGKTVVVEVVAKKPDTNASDEFAVAYSTNSVGNSGWQRFTPSTEWKTYKFVVNISSTNTNEDYVGVWGDTSATGKGVLIDSIKVLVPYEDGIAGFVDAVYKPEVTSLKEQVDKKVEYFYQLSTQANPDTWPASEDSLHDGDVLHYTDTNESFYFSGTTGTWNAIQDKDALQAIFDAADAQATADGKITTYYGTRAGTTGEAVGDLLVASDEDNKLYRWNGASWVDSQDKGIVAIAEDVTALSTDVAVIGGVVREGSIGNFNSGLSFWSPSRSGAPDTITTLTGTIRPDSEIGNGYVWTPTTAGQNVTRKQVELVSSNAVYKVKSRFKVTSLPADGSFVINHVVVGLNQNYNHVSTLFTTGMTITALGVYELEELVSIDGENADHSWPSGSVYLRSGLRLSSNESNLEILVSSIQVEDVTQASLVAGSVSLLENTLRSEIVDGVASVESKFAYGSTLNLNGTYYSSGFGLNATATGGAGTIGDPYDSEFWINAEKLKLINPNDSSGSNPFTVAIGTGQVTFNGVVNFSSTNMSDYDNSTVITSVSDNLVASTGAVPAYGSSLVSNLSYDSGEQAIRLYSSSDNTIGLAFPAFRVNTTANEKVNLSLSYKSNVNTSSGMYIRVYEYDSDLPSGKTHVSNNASVSSPVVQEDTRQKSSWKENAAVTTAWVTSDYEYIPSSTAKWASVVVLNWTNLGVNSLYIKGYSKSTTGVDIDTSSLALKDMSNVTTIDGGKITTGTISAVNTVTSTTGQRVELSGTDSSLRAYDTNNELVIRVGDNTDLVSLGLEQDYSLENTTTPILVYSNAETGALLRSKRIGACLDVDGVNTRNYGAVINVTSLYDNSLNYGIRCKMPTPVTKLGCNQIAGYFEVSDGSGFGTGVKTWVKAQDYATGFLGIAESLDTSFLVQGTAKTVTPLSTTLETYNNLYRAYGTYTGAQCYVKKDGHDALTIGGTFSSTIYNDSGQTLTNSDFTSIGVKATTSQGGFGGNGIGSTSMAIGVWASGGNFDFYAGGSGTNLGYGTYAPFTGSHDCLISDYASFEAGDICCDSDFVTSRGLSNTLFKVLLSNYAKKPPIGVLSGRISMRDTTMIASFNPGEKIPEGYSLASFNALGEGQVNVCGEGGSLSNGDLIVTSSIPGKGMRQNKDDGTPDDVVRNITVAKVRGNWEFDSPSEVKMVPCIYLCG